MKKSKAKKEKTPKVKKVRTPRHTREEWKSLWKEWIIDWTLYMIGCALYAAAIALFTAPNEIAPGGISGVATLLNHLFDLPIGVMVIVMNIPIIIVGWIVLGRNFVLKSAVNMAVSSVMIDIFAAYIPPFKGDVMLVVIAGGALVGAGLGLLFMRGASTGGTDILAQLLERKIRHIPIGRFMLLLDGLVITASVFVYGHIENALYAGVFIFISSSLIDAIVYGNDKGKMVLISSQKEQKITEAIIHKMDRGITKLNAVGGYTGAERAMLLVAVRRSEVHKLKMLVYEQDPAAFFIILTTDEVLGEGFKPAEK